MLVHFSINSKLYLQLRVTTNQKNPTAILVKLDRSCCLSWRFWNWTRLQAGEQRKAILKLVYSIFVRIKASSTGNLKIKLMLLSFTSFSLQIQSQISIQILRSLS